MEIKKETAGVVKKITSYLKETEAEAKKVVWPDRKYVVAATTIVIAIVALCAVYVMVLDFGFGKLFIMLESGRPRI